MVDMVGNLNNFRKRIIRPWLRCFMFCDDTTNDNRAIFVLEAFHTLFAVWDWCPDGRWDNYLDLLILCRVREVKDGLIFEGSRNGFLDDFPPMFDYLIFLVIDYFDDLIIQWNRSIKISILDPFQGIFQVTYPFFIDLGIL